MQAIDILKRHKLTKHNRFNKYNECLHTVPAKNFWNRCLFFCPGGTMQAIVLF